MILWHRRQQPPTTLGRNLNQLFHLLTTPLRNSKVANIAMITRMKTTLMTVTLMMMIPRVAMRRPLEVHMLQAIKDRICHPCPTTPIRWRPLMFLCRGKHQRCSQKLQTRTSWAQHRQRSPKTSKWTSTWTSRACTFGSRLTVAITWRWHRPKWSQNSKASRSSSLISSNRVSRQIRFHVATKTLTGCTSDLSTNIVCFQFHHCPISRFPVAMRINLLNIDERSFSNSSIGFVVIQSCQRAMFGCIFWHAKTRKSGRLEREWRRRIRWVDELFLLQLDNNFWHFVAHRTNILRCHSNHAWKSAAADHRWRTNRQLQEFHSGNGRSGEDVGVSEQRPS